MRSFSIRKLVFSAMLASLVFAATWIQIPAPLGNINLGDSILLAGVWMLGGPLSCVACAIGAALADLVSGYAIYAPATLLIKAAMAFSAMAIVRHREHCRHPYRFTVLSAIVSEIIMVVGYFLYEGLFLYGFPAALLAIPFNLVQGTVCAVISLLLCKLFDHANLFHNL